MNQAAEPVRQKQTARAIYRSGDKLFPLCSEPEQQLKLQAVTGIYIFS
jgi:hypothetical protein